MTAPQSLVPQLALSPNLGQNCLSSMLLALSKIFESSVLVPFHLLRSNVCRPGPFIL